MMMKGEQQRTNLNDFTMLSQIGIGNYAKVILVRKKQNNKVYAMKIIKKHKEINQIKGIKRQHAYIEKQILMECQFPFIVKLFTTFQRHKKLYYVLEYCPGGELFGLIKRLKRFSQENAKFYAAQIILAIQYLHQKKYIYRDLKPENVLIDRKGFIKLIDFGLSCKMDQVKLTDAIAGTPEYMPPEIFEKGNHISPATDWWALGNIIFEMVAGFPPFFAPNQKIAAIKTKICQEEPPLHFISNPLLKDLLQKLLNKNPRERLGSKSCEAIKSHGWFYGTNWEGLLHEQVSPPFRPNIKGDADIHWFEVEPQEMSPPEQSSAGERQNIDKYNSFSSSWKSNRQLEMVEQAASPPQILVIMTESKPR